MMGASMLLLMRAAIAAAVANAILDNAPTNAAARAADGLRPAPPPDGWDTLENVR